MIVRPWGSRGSKLGLRGGYVRYLLRDLGLGGGDEADEVDEAGSTRGDASGVVTDGSNKWEERFLGMGNRCVSVCGCVCSVWVRLGRGACG